MANKRQNDRRKVIRREGSRRRNDIKTIKIERSGDKEQEVTIGHGANPETKEKSTWSWHGEHEEFTVEWSATFLTKKKGKSRKKGE